MEFLGSFIVRIDKRRTTLHILQTLLVFAAFICGIILLADRSMPRSRSTTLVLVYSIKSFLIILYQYLSQHKARFQRFASSKAYAILNALECLFWFTALIITCMAGGKCRESLCAKVGVGVTVVVLLWATYLLTAMLTMYDWRQSKKVSTSAYV